MNIEELTKYANDNNISILTTKGKQYRARHKILENIQKQVNNKKKVDKLPDKEEKVKKNLETKKEKGNKEEEVKKKDKYFPIQEKDDITDLFENLHHLLWSRCGFSPETAMNHLTLFMFLKIIEPNIEKMGLSDKCKFSELSKIKSDEELYEIFKDIVLVEISENPNLGEHFKDITYDFKVNKADVLKSIIKHMNRIQGKVEDRDFLGDVIEYIIGRGMTTMADDGQYYTSRELCDYGYELEPVRLNKDGSIPTFIDPFGGTGGFAISFMKSIKKINPNIDWNSQKDKIYLCDIKINSVRIALLNLFAITGINFKSDNFRSKNSFYETLFKGKKFQDMGSNPPYGGDKDKGDEFKFKYKNKSGKFNVSKEIQEIGIEIDDKVAASLQLYMSLLDKGGVCRLVLSEGFFFGSGKKLTKIRQYLIENFNVKYIVDIPQGQFENTPTKTSLLIFVNDGNKTSNIKFIDFDTKNILTNANYKEIVEKKYSLNFKRYIKQNWNISNDYKISKFDNILTFVKKNNKYKASDGKKKGKYKFFTSSQDKILYRDDYEFKNHHMLIGRGGKSSIHYANKFSVSHDDVYVITLNNNSKNNLKYIYYFLKSNIKIIEDGYQGTTIKHNSKSYLNKLEFPLPSIEKQNEIVENIDRYMDMVNQGKKMINLMEQALISETKQLYMSNKCENKKINDICEFMKKSKRKAGQAQKEGKYRFYICSRDKVKYLNTADYKNESIIVGTGGIPVINIDSNFSCSADNFIIKSKFENIKNYWIYNVIKSNMNLLENGFTGTTIKHINKSYLQSIEIPVPDIEIQKQLEPQFNLIKDMKKQLKIWSKKADELIKNSLEQATKKD